VPYISKIELRGFKSFGNSKVTIPLSKGLTAIIGPNGNGKSNIVDALCFVLGGMSAKTMRAERFSDLLFRGGNGHRPAPFAEVSIYFNNQDGRIPVGAKEVVVSRWVNRSGKCVYRINDKRVSRQEIVDLLAPIMASPGGYNFVMQGDVGFFVKMSPLERRLVLDEMAGVAEYDEKKAKAVEELAKVEANLSTAGSVLQEIARRMETLRGQMETALRCRALMAELEQLRGAIAVLKKKKLEAKISGASGRIEKLDERITELRRKFDGLIRDGESCRSRADKLEEDIDRMQSDTALEEARRAHASIQAVQGLLEAAFRRKAEFEKELQRVEALISKAAEGGHGAKNLVLRLRELHGRFRELLGLATGDPQRMADAVQEMRFLLDEMLSAIDGLEKELLNPQAPRPGSAPSLQGLREERAGIKRALEEIDAQVMNLEKRLAEARALEEKWMKDETRVKAGIYRLRVEKESLRKRAAEIEARAREVDRRIRELEGEKQRQELQRASWEAELQEIREELKKFGVGPAVQESADLNSLERRSQEIEEEIRSFGEVNYRAIRDFREEERRHASEKGRYDKLVAEKESILNFMREVDEKKKEVFMKTFNEVAKHFSEIFSELSPEGTAQLVLENEESPFEGGLNIIARPQGKNFVSLESLSGGEKALTALAFIFALQRYRPTMFYILDEIDAHLDPQNRKRVAEMLRKFSKNSQILVITLHDAIMAAADRLFGITMEDRISKVFSVELSGLGG